MKKKLIGDFIGCAELHEIKQAFEEDFIPGVEIGWRLAADYHNQRYATEATKTVMNLEKM